MSHVLTTPSTTEATSQLDKVSRGDEKWMDDAEANNCKRCNIDFHAVKRRKHHCRMCGFLVCNDCSRGRIQLKKTGKKSRVCNECFNIVAPRHMTTPSTTPLIPDGEPKPSRGYRPASEINENAEPIEQDEDGDSHKSNHVKTNTVIYHNPLEITPSQTEDPPTNEPKQPLLEPTGTRCCHCNIL